MQDNIQEKTVSRWLDLASEKEDGITQVAEEMEEKRHSYRENPDLESQIFWCVMALVVVERSSVSSPPSLVGGMVLESYTTLDPEPQLSLDESMKSRLLTAVATTSSILAEAEYPVEKMTIEEWRRIQRALDRLVSSLVLMMYRRGDVPFLPYATAKQIAKAWTRTCECGVVMTAFPTIACELPRTFEQHWFGLLLSLLREEFPTDSYEGIFTRIGKLCVGPFYYRRSHELEDFITCVYGLWAVVSKTMSHLVPYLALNGVCRVIPDALKEFPVLDENHHDKSKEVMGILLSLHILSMSMTAGIPFIREALKGGILQYLTQHSELFVAYESAHLSSISEKTCKITTLLFDTVSCACSTLR